MVERLTPYTVLYAPTTERRRAQRGRSASGDVMNVKYYNQSFKTLPLTRYCPKY